MSTLLPLLGNVWMGSRSDVCLWGPTLPRGVFQILRAPSSPSALDPSLFSLWKVKISGKVKSLYGRYFMGELIPWTVIRGRLAVVQSV